MLHMQKEMQIDSSWMTVNMSAKMMAQKKSNVSRHFKMSIALFSQFNYILILYAVLLKNQHTLTIQMKSASDWALTLWIALSSFENLSLYWLDQQRFVFLEFKTIDWFVRAFFAIYYMIFQLIFSCIYELDKPFVSISTWSLSSHFWKIYQSIFSFIFTHAAFKMIGWFFEASLFRV